MTKYAEFNMIILPFLKKKKQENSIPHAEDIFDVIQLKWFKQHLHMQYFFSSLFCD